MSDDRLTLTRQELYELAWSKPMNELARDFGISDVALAKRCRNLHIPVPGRGYWARVAAGQAPPRPDLPERKPTWRDHRALMVEPPAKGTVDRLPEAANAHSLDADTRAKLEHLSVSLSQDLREATSAVKRTALVHKHPNRGQMPFARGEKTGAILDLHVSAGALDRALLFADALLRTAESLGWSFVEPLPEEDGSGGLLQRGNGHYHPPTSTSDIGELLVDGERIAFRIEERTTEVPRQLTRAERRYERSADGRSETRVDLQFTGALRLVRLDRNCGSERRKTWYDHRGRRVENRIPEVLRNFFELALEIKARRVEAERRRREREEEERQRRELEERREANGRLVKALELQAGAWHRARFLRAYLRAARRALPEGVTIGFLGNRIDFLQWAEQYVNGLDPLHAQPRTETMLPERSSWAGSSELKDGLSRLAGHEWAKSWKHAPRSDVRGIDDLK